MVKIPGLILVLVLIYAAWYQGAEYWAERIHSRRGSPQRGGIVIVLLGIVFLNYITWVIDRYRKSR